MSPKGSPGTAKTAEHKSKISTSMQTKAELRAQGRRLAADATLRASNLLAGPMDAKTLSAVVTTLAGAVRNLILADEASLELSEEVKADLKAALEQARNDSQSFRIAMASVEDFDIIRAKSIGLIPAAEADRVLKRRQVGRVKDSLSGAVASGWLPCAESGCMSKVDLSTGASRCQEHRKAPPRTFVERSTSGLKTVTLDLDLEDAEAAHAKAEKALVAAQKALEAVRVRIDEYDKAAGG